MPLNLKPILTSQKSFKNANVGERLSFEIEKEVQKKLRVKLKREE